MKRTADILAPGVAVVFLGLLCLGSFPVCWRVANVTRIQKGPLSSSEANYRKKNLSTYAVQSVCESDVRSSGAV